jgi:hypothetical protein
MILKPEKPLKEISSYRPILLEKFIQNRIIKFLEENNVISPHQSGLRTNHSTMDNVFKLINDLINHFNNHEECSTWKKLLIKLLMAPRAFI